MYIIYYIIQGSCSIVLKSMSFKIIEDYVQITFLKIIFNCVKTSVNWGCNPCVYQFPCT